MDHYGVIGNPIQHSKSPFLHQLYAEQTKQAIHYEAVLVEPSHLEKTIDDIQSQGWKGLNVTLPFKHRAFALVDQLTERAQRAEAINTIKFNEEGTRLGDNTDGVGLIRDIRDNLKFSLRKKRILVLGAGGAVRGVLDSLLSEQPDEVVIANRSENKAVMLAEAFSHIGFIQACPLSLLESNSFDLVINGTSASLQDEMLDLPGSILKEGALCYDMVYGKGATPFLRWANEQGAAQGFDGLGMLAEQAAESFNLWRGVQPDTKAALAVLRPMLAPAEII